MVEVGPPLTRLSVIVKNSPDQNVRVAIPVYVAGAANAVAIERTWTRLPRPGGRGREPRRGAVVQVGLGRLASPHQNIRVPIPVNIAGGANAPLREGGTYI